MNRYIPGRTKLGEQGRAATALSVILLLVIVGAAAAAATYYWQQRKINDLNNRVAALSAQQSKQQGSQQSTNTQPAASSSSGESFTSQKGVKITLYTPAKNAKVTSPVGVVGKVPGNWSNEASFPVQLKDSSGKVVAQGTGQVLGDWQTSQPVPFSVKLTYSSAAPGAGTLVLQKDNPSGQSSNDDSVSIPIQL